VIVRTVLGDIDPAELGPCDAHEHLFLDTPAQPGEEFLDVGKAIEETQTLADAGARSVVDCVCQANDTGCRAGVGQPTRSQEHR